MDHREVEDRLRELPPSSKFIYRTLETQGSLTLKGLTEETLLSSRTARYGLEQLEEAGLVNSAPALHDGRQTCYSLERGPWSHPHDQYAKRAILDPSELETSLDEVRTPAADVRLVEVSDSYDEWHVPGAVELNPEAVLNPGHSGVPQPDEFGRIVGERGIAPDTTVVLYGEEYMEFPAFVYWLFKYYRHTDVRLLNGTKACWRERGYPTTTEVPEVVRQPYETPDPNEAVRAYRRDVQTALADGTTFLDVRTRGEFLGEEGPLEDDAPTPRVEGRIPDSANLVWTDVLTDERQFESAGRLERMVTERGVEPDDDVVVYCNLGERSALVWFVLSELLGYRDVANYDGSWAEWGNLIDAPVETGASDED